MKPQTITRNFTKMAGPPSVTLFRSVIPYKIVQKHRGELAAALAHEVRNPLSNINLALEMLKSTAPDEEQGKYLAIITRSSLRIKEALTELFTSFQTDAMKPEKHSIHQLLNEVLVMNEDRIKPKHITVQKDYTGGDCKILVNKHKIIIALTNIIINAIEAMPAVNGELQLAAKSTNGKVVIEIKDNGSGISQENLKNIFNPYFSSKPNGIGLGLSTTLDILLANHVGVAVQSEEGSGTRFILSFDKAQNAGEIII